MKEVLEELEIRRDRARAGGGTARRMLVRRLRVLAVILRALGSSDAAL